jgi:hypothetical protein
MFEGVVFPYILIKTTDILEYAKAVQRFPLSLSARSCERRKRIRRSRNNLSCPRSGSVTFGCECRPALRQKNKEEPEKSKDPECRRNAPDNLLLGCRPAFAPEGNGAAPRTKEGCRARCADILGASLSSPVRAEHVLSLRKPLQRLICRGLGSPSVGLQTESVCRGKWK